MIGGAGWKDGQSVLFKQVEGPSQLLGVQGHPLTIDGFTNE
jgi:hypothetical protein